MIFPLPQRDAELECLKLMELFDSRKRIDVLPSMPLECNVDSSSLCRDSNNMEFSTDYLWGNACGQMFGSCVCLNENNERIVLYAFSCQYNGHFSVLGYVPPLLDLDEYNQIVVKNDREIHNLTSKIKEIEQLDNNSAGKLSGQSIELSKLKENRKKLSQSSMAAIFKLYKVHCPDGTIYAYDEIFPHGIMPPTGTGDCCAPKLLDYANRHNLRPVSLAEFYYGAANKSGTRIHKKFYPPCDEKCKPLMKYLLGLDIIYRDESIVVVNKPAGLLSVPGRGADKQDCVVNRLRRIFPDCIEQPSVHRLDMDTSGLLVLALTKESHRNLSLQFETGVVQKKYVAVLDGVLPSEKGVSGKIELPFRLDVENRPHQIYDEANGKMGISLWQIISPSNDEFHIYNKTRNLSRSVVLFTPLTGRTHQLRLHSSHSLGLGIPIEGDRLYGERKANERMMLHAVYLSFNHPLTNKKLEFISLPDWEWQKK